MKKVVLAVAMSSAMLAGGVNAADMGHGTIKFTGSIIDAPCSISSESSEQTIYLGEVSNVTLKNKGRSESKPFFINLEQCDVNDMSSVTATFTGASSSGNPDMLGITGTAKGASIAITDGSGSLIALGKSSASQTIQEGPSTLAFAAYIQGDGASITAGNFTSTVDFTLAYQ